MKKSNRLLLAILFTAVLLLSAVHIALYAKYQNGDYTTLTGDDDLVPVLSQSFPHARFVAVRNVSDVAVSFADSVKIESGDAAWKQSFSFAHAGDTLLVSGLQAGRRYAGVHIYVPQLAQLTASNSSLLIRNNKVTPGAGLHLFLDNSSATLNGEGAASPFGTVAVTAIKKSSVKLQSTTIHNLDVSLAESELTDAAGTISNLTIAADSTSRVSLQAKHFLKAKQPLANE